MVHRIYFHLYRIQTKLQFCKKFEKKLGNCPNLHVAPYTALPFNTAAMDEAQKMSPQQPSPSNLLTRLRWSRGSALAFGTQVCGFGAKKSSAPSFGGEVKPSVPCRRFTACKRSLNVTWKLGIFRQNSSTISRPCSSTINC